MKKVLAIAVLLLMASMAMAASGAWVMNITAGSPNDFNQGAWPIFGEMAGALDGVDGDWEIGNETVMPYPNASKYAQMVVDGAVYSQDIMSDASYDTYSASEKVWAFVVGTENAAPLDGTKIAFRTQPDVALLPAPATDVMGYFVRLVDNKGVAFDKPAWAGGGAWLPGDKIELAIPEAGETEFGAFQVPDLRLALGATGGTLLASGYRFEFVQGPKSAPVVPEPGSLMVLGTGLVGLLGLVSRKRRV